MTKSNIITSILFAGFSTFAIGGISHAASGHDEKTMTVFKTPWCGCCQVWVEAIERAGYTVKVNDLDDLSSIKQQAGISISLEGCHTAVLGGERKYVLEGHVPLAAIEKLQSEKPEIRGISTPGMPMGSLGMGYDESAQYTVYAYTSDPAADPTVFYEAGRSE